MNDTRTIDSNRPRPRHHDPCRQVRVPGTSWAAPGMQITVLGARGVGKSTVSQLVVTLLARRGLPVALVGAMSSEAGDRSDLQAPSGSDPVVACPATITVHDTRSWQDTLALQVHGVDQVVVVTTPEISAMQFAMQATRLVHHGGADHVHLVINRVAGSTDMQRAIENLAQLDPTHASQYTSIHTLPEEPGSLSSDVDGWSRALRDDRRITGSALANAVSWVADALVPTLVGMAG